MKSQKYRIRIKCLVLCLVMMFGLAIPGLAAEETDVQIETVQEEQSETTVTVPSAVSETQLSAETTAEAVQASEPEPAVDGAEDQEVSSGSEQHEDESSQAESGDQNSGAVNTDAEDDGENETESSDTADGSNTDENAEALDSAENEREDGNLEQSSGESVNQEETVLVQQVSISAAAPAAGDVLSEESVASALVDGIIPAEAQLESTSLEGSYFGDAECLTKLVATLVEGDICYGCFHISIQDGSCCVLDEADTMVSITGASLVAVTDSEPGADYDDDSREEPEAVGKDLWIVVSYSVEAEISDTEETEEDGTGASDASGDDTSSDFDDLETDSTDGPEESTTGSSDDETDGSGEDEEDEADSSETEEDEAESTDASEEEETASSTSGKSSGKSRGSRSGSSSSSGSRSGSSSRSGSHSGKSGSGSRSGGSSGHGKTSSEETSSGEELEEPEEESAADSAASVFGIGIAVARERYFSPDVLSESSAFVLSSVTSRAKEKCLAL